MADDWSDDKAADMWSAANLKPLFRRTDDDGWDDESRNDVPDPVWPKDHIWDKKKTRVSDRGDDRIAGTTLNSHLTNDKRHGGHNFRNNRPTERPHSSVDRQREPNWICTFCRSEVFGSKSACYKCHQPKSVDAKEAPPNSGGGRKRANDWICSKCSVTVFGSKSICFKCQAPKGDSKDAPIKGDLSRDKNGFFPTLDRIRQVRNRLMEAKQSKVDQSLHQSHYSHALSNKPKAADMDVEIIEIKQEDSDVDSVDTVIGSDEDEGIVFPKGIRNTKKEPGTPKYLQGQKKKVRFENPSEVGPMLKISEVFSYNQEANSTSGTSMVKQTGSDIGIDRTANKPFTTSIQSDAVRVVSTSHRIRLSQTPSEPHAKSPKDLTKLAPKSTVGSKRPHTMVSNTGAISEANRTQPNDSRASRMTHQSTTVRSDRSQATSNQTDISKLLEVMQSNTTAMQILTEQNAKMAMLLNHLSGKENENTNVLATAMLSSPVMAQNHNNGIQRQHVGIIETNEEDCIVIDE